MNGTSTSQNSITELLQSLSEAFHTVAIDPFSASNWQPLLAVVLIIGGAFWKYTQIGVGVMRFLGRFTRKPGEVAARCLKLLESDAVVLDKENLKVMAGPLVVIEEQLRSVGDKESKMWFAAEIALHGSRLDRHLTTRERKKILKAAAAAKSRVLDNEHKQDEQERVHQLDLALKAASISTAEPIQTKQPVWGAEKARCAGCEKKEAALVCYQHALNSLQAEKRCVR